MDDADWGAIFLIALVAVATMAAIAAGVIR